MLERMKLTTENDSQATSEHLRSRHESGLLSRQIGRELLMKLRGVEVDSRETRGVVADDGRRLCPWRYAAQDCLRHRRHLGDCRIDAHVRLKENANHGNAGQRLRLDVLHVIDR
jgi:hypothetical protein